MTAPRVTATSPTPAFEFLRAEIVQLYERQANLLGSIHADNQLDKRVTQQFRCLLHDAKEETGYASILHQACKMIAKEVGVAHISPPDDLRLNVAITGVLVPAIHRHYSLDSCIADDLQLFRQMLLVEHTHCQRWLTQDGTELEAYMALILRLWICVDRYSGRRASGLLGAITDSLKRSVDRSSSGLCQNYAQVLEQLVAVVGAFSSTVADSESKLQRMEVQQLEKQSARQVVMQQIRDKCYGVWIPETVLDFLDGIWSKLLYVIYLRQGPQSPEWIQGLEDIDTLIWSVNVRSREELWSAYADRISSSIARMRGGIETINHDTEAATHFFDWLDAVHVAILDQRSPEVGDCSDLELRDGLPEPEDSDSDSKPEEEIQVAEPIPLRPGDWVSLNVQSHSVRCKLCYRDASRSRWLFTNLSGTKVTFQTDHELRQAFEMQSCIKLPLIAPMQDIKATVLTSLATYQQELEQRVALMARERATVRKEAKRQEFVQRARVQEEQHRQVLDEQQRQAREVEQQQKIGQERRETEAQLEHCRQRAIALDAGAVVRFRDGKRSEVLKLGMLLETTEKLIFVNEMGMKSRTMTVAEFASGLFAGSVEIVKQGVAFESSIENLVIGRRAYLKEQ